MGHVITTSDPYRMAAKVLKLPMHYAARAMGGVTFRQKKREELESESSHKSDILPPAAYKKEVVYFEKIFFRL